MGQQLGDGRSLDWIAVETRLEDVDGQRVAVRGEFDGVIFIDNGANLVQRVSKLVKRRLLEDQIVQDAAQRPNVRFLVNLEWKWKWI